MALGHDGKAPYAPVEPITELIEKFRGTGLALPVTSDVLARAGVSESLIPRVMVTLRLLDLIDDAGQPTDTLDLLRRAPTPEYKERLAEWVRGAYAPIFQFVDPATTTAEAIEDAFRGYEPAGQRGRMVTLFSGLCEYAGIVDTAPTKKRGPAASGTSRGLVVKRTADGKTIITRKDPPKKDPPKKDPTPPSPPGSFSQVVDLRSGGSLTVSVLGNPLGFSSEDREFVFKIVDSITAYRERRMLTANTPEGDSS